MCWHAQKLWGVVWAVAKLLHLLRASVYTGQELAFSLCVFSGEALVYLALDSEAPWHCKHVKLGMFAGTCFLQLGHGLIREWVWQRRWEWLGRQGGGVVGKWEGKSGRG